MREHSFYVHYSPPFSTVYDVRLMHAFVLILTTSRAQPTHSTLSIVTILQCELRLQYAGIREYTHRLGNLGVTHLNPHSASTVGCQQKKRKNLHRHKHWRLGRQRRQQSHNFQHLLPHLLCIQAVLRPHLHPRLHKGQDPVRQGMPLLFWAQVWKMNLQGLVHSTILFIASVLFYTGRVIYNTKHIGFNSFQDYKN